MHVELAHQVILGDYNMNRVDFMNQVKNWLGNATDEQKDLFILDQASKTSLRDREAFLKNLKKPSPIKEDVSFDQRRYNRIVRDLREIKELDLSVYGEFDPDADYWDDEEFIYEDADGIAFHIDEAISFFYELADDGCESQAISLGEEILKTPIRYNTDYDSYEADLDALYSDDLLSHRPDLFQEDFLTLVLNTAPPAERSTAFAREIIKLGESIDGFPPLLIFLENHKEEIGDLNDFLITFFGEIFTSDIRPGLLHRLRPLLYMIQDNDLFLEETRMFTEKDPESLPAIFQVLEERLSPNELIDFADEMLSEIPPDVSGRSDITDAAWRAAKALGDEKKQGDYLLESFRNDPSLERFLGLVARTEDFIPKNPAFTSDFNEICSRTQSRKENLPFRGWMEKRGCLSREDGKRIKFLLGDRKDWIKELTKPEQIWELDTLHFFLMVLCSPDRVEDQYDLFRTTTTDGLGICVREPYCFGKDVSNALNRLLNEIPISEDDSELLLAHTLRRLNSRVLKGLRTQDRKAYPEIAKEIYAAGKLLEDHGEKDGSVLLMHHYQHEFPRHRAFENELKKYGFNRKEHEGEILELPLLNRLLNQNEGTQLKILPD